MYIYILFVCMYIFAIYIYIEMFPPVAFYFAAAICQQIPSAAICFVMS